MKVLLATLCLLISHSIFSQTYYKGYIIRDDQKEEGLISYRPSIDDKPFIKFKKTDSDEAQKLSGDDISGFYLNDFDAEFITVREEKTGNKVFTEILVKGPATLSVRSSLYVLTVGQDELQTYLPIVVESSSTGRPDPVEKSRLSSLLVARIKLTMDGECWSKELEERPESFNTTSFQSAVRKYNECKGEKGIKKKKGLLHPVLLVGYQTQDVKFIEDNLNLYNVSPSYRVSGGVEFVPRKFGSKITFSVLAGYWKSKYTLKKGGTSVDQLEHGTLEFAGVLKLFFLPAQRGPYVLGGVAPSWNLWDAQANSTPPVKQQFGAMIGAGYDIPVGASRISVALKYDRGVTEHLLPTGKQSAVLFEAGFRL